MTDASRGLASVDRDPSASEPGDTRSICGQKRDRSGRAAERSPVRLQIRAGAAVGLDPAVSLLRPLEIRQFVPPAGHCWNHEPPGPSSFIAPPIAASSSAWRIARAAALRSDPCRRQRRSGEAGSRSLSGMLVGALVI